MAAMILVFWIGSLIAGWYAFWFWLIVPVVGLSLHVGRVTSRMRVAQRELGILQPGQRPAFSMVRANVRLIVLSFAQQLAIFLVGFGAHWLIR